MITSVLKVLLFNNLYYQNDCSYNTFVKMYYVNLCHLNDLIHFAIHPPSLNEQLRPQKHRVALSIYVTVD